MPLKLVQLNLMVSEGERARLGKLQERLQDRLGRSKALGVATVRVSLRATLAEALTALEARLDDMERPR